MRMDLEDLRVQVRVNVDMIPPDDLRKMYDRIKELERKV
jgi:hypothetical protein